MTKRRSDALQALVAEVVDIEGAIESARAAEEEARVEFVAAQQTLNLKRTYCKEQEARLQQTDNALSLIQARDDIADDTIDALKERARS